MTLRGQAAAGLSPVCAGKLEPMVSSNRIAVVMSQGFPEGRLRRRISSTLPGRQEPLDLFVVSIMASGSTPVPVEPQGTLLN